MLDSDIASLRERLERGETTALALAQHALRRVARIDRDGPRLGAVPVLDPRLLERAVANDAQRTAAAAGAPEAVPLGPLHGIPFTVKDSFAVAGLTAAAGSPAFANTVARRDAVVVERLLAAGALLVGKTNMPPMAIGGGQAGLYGRTRSPYSPEWLAAAWHSGSSIGSGVAVAASLCAFGLGEETVSSGRSPASNNALVAYTPSWGVVPSVGNWPLHPYRDVVVPHTRTVSDLREVLAVIAGADDRDVWQQQDTVDVSAAETVAARFRAKRPGADPTPLDGLVVGVPTLYVPSEDADSSATAATPSIPLRPSIRDRWDALEHELVTAGARVVRVRFPLVESYEGRGTAASLEETGHLAPEWTAFELRELMTVSWQRFLDDHATEPVSLSDLTPGAIRPDPPYALDAVENGRVHPGRDVFDFTAITRDAPLSDEQVSAVAGPAIAGLDRARRELFEDWLRREGLDVVAFPANSDIGPHDADVDPESARAAWADGAVFSTTNHVLRRVGIPSVTIPMGTMADTGMPVGATICGPAFSDAHLVDVADALEARLAPRTRPRLPDVAALGAVRSAGAGPTTVQGPITAHLRGTATVADDGGVLVEVHASVDGGHGLTSAWIEVGSMSVGVPTSGTTAARFHLGPEARRTHHATRVLALLTVIGPDGLVAAADVLDLPFRRPAPGLRPTSPIRSTP
ncbi:amidase family protein [Curtobacterium sp. PhB146]|uniref:amidase family protein n=1 Tax=Curtobacterium sp. PhB146 TaxID=2485187 RepID=UPI00104C194B|nr:amidase family protein [Curtobacterium sp. PhB146]TCU43763.1 amidase [Curtobacterium sp. PhB146]